MPCCLEQIWPVTRECCLWIHRQWEVDFKVMMILLRNRKIYLWLKSFLVEHKDTFILHGRYHVCWWQMETFSALLAICVGNSPVSSEFPAQRPVTRSFDIFFDLRLNKRLSKQSWGWWFEPLSCPLWRQCNERNPSGSEARKCREI